ncbi:MAG: hypothetical protein AAFO95_12360 [Cyanobacteria bacterium J06600_6]
MIENKILKMILAKFRHRYPQGSLVSELIEIDRGTYIVKALVEIDQIVLATALAGAATVEAAEDAAKERAIATLFLEDRVDRTVASVPSPAPQKTVPASSPVAPKTVTPKQNLNFDQPQSVKQEQPLTPLTVPLKPVPETKEFSLEPEPVTNPTQNLFNDIPNEPAPIPKAVPTQNLFSDIPSEPASAPEPIVETREDSTLVEQNTAGQELEAMDFNEIKQKTDIEIKRLGWTKDQGKEFLMSRYGKRSRLHLTDEQLLEFLRYLETLPNPVK